MKKFLYLSLSLLALIMGGASSLQAGVLFYVPIPASESDPNSGISEENTYTTAVDGGNARGTDRVINGITLYAMTGEGQTLSANNCSLTVLEGTVANGGGGADSIKADGALSEVVSDMTFNNEANDGSEQEIVTRSREPYTRHDVQTCAFTFPTHRDRTGRLISSFLAMASPRWSPVGLTRMMRRLHRVDSRTRIRFTISIIVTLGMETRLPASRSRNAMGARPFVFTG